MNILELSKPDRGLHGDLTLEGSKSISNRALIVLALSGADPDSWLTNLSSSKDTLTLQRLLTQKEEIYDAGDAGTTFRFMTAYLALQPGIQVLTGSARMRERPVGALVYALRSLGADIRFLEKEGFPPLEIGSLTPGGPRQIQIAADVSSQFLSALALIAPYLPEGLEIIPEGPLVSRPYIDMTIRLMQYFGAQAGWQGDRLVVEPGPYQARPLTVEADWSAASYWYAMAAFAGEVDLTLRGLWADSWQGDSVLTDMMPQFGLQSVFHTNLTGTPAMSNAVRIIKTGSAPTARFEWDFITCPDIAQTLAVVCAGLGVPGRFSGLETLIVKETDRIAAIQAELQKVGVDFSRITGPDEAPERIFYQLSGQASWSAPPRFATYGDHRMAMAFAPLAFFGPIQIENPEVVEKSYPGFWRHMGEAGFEMKGI